MHFRPCVLLIVCGLSGGLAIPVKPIVQTIGGIGEFINQVRSHFGKAGDFATQNGFEYGNVYNSLLQYSIINAHLEKQNHRLLVAQRDETAAMREDTGSYYYRDTVINSVFYALFLAITAGTLIVNSIMLCRFQQRRRREQR